MVTFHLKWERTRVVMLPGIVTTKIKQIIRLGSIDGMCEVFFLRAAFSFPYCNLNCSNNIVLNCKQT